MGSGAVFKASTLLLMFAFLLFFIPASLASDYSCSANGSLSDGSIVVLRMANYSPGSGLVILTIYPEPDVPGAGSFNADKHRKIIITE